MFTHKRTNRRFILQGVADVLSKVRQTGRQGYEWKGDRLIELGRRTFVDASLHQRIMFLGDTTGPPLLIWILATPRGRRLPE